MKTKIFLLLILVLLAMTTVSFADTVVVDHTSTYPYFHSGTNPLGTLFYFVGDLVAFPFRLIGDFFDYVF